MRKLALIILPLFALILFGCSSKPTINLDEFAKCLTTAGAKMYGLETCGHCQDQKAMFHDSFQYINYIDCKINPAVCTTLKGVPTREFKDGTKLEGLQKLSILSEKTNCKLPQ